VFRLRRLYLHVGTHKTGTSSLQAYLLDQRVALKNRNVTVITETHRSFGEIATCLGFAHGILRNGLRTVARMTGSMPSGSSIRGWLYRRRVRILLGQLQENESAVLSAEALCFARTNKEAKRLRKVFTGLDLEVVPVICFRNDEDWRASWESELHAWSERMIKSGGEGMNDIRGEWYFDRESIVSFWKQFGDVRCVDFDEAVARDGSVLPAALEALDLQVSGSVEAYRLRKRQEPA